MPWPQIWPSPLISPYCYNSFISVILLVEKRLKINNLLILSYLNGCFFLFSFLHTVTTKLKLLVSITSNYCPTSPTYLQRSTGIGDWITAVRSAHGEHRRGYRTIRNQSPPVCRRHAATKAHAPRCNWNRPILERCVAEIKDWCESRRLQLNADKAEVIWFGSRADAMPVYACCLCLAGRVSFSTRAPVQSLTTANQRRTYTCIFSHSSMRRTSATGTRYSFYQFGWVNQESTTYI